MHSLFFFTHSSLKGTYIGFTNRQAKKFTIFDILYYEIYYFNRRVFYFSGVCLFYIPLYMYIFPARLDLITGFTGRNVYNHIETHQGT